MEIWFPERATNFYLVFSRENSSVAIIQYSVLHYLLEAGARGLDNVVKRSKCADFPELESDSPCSHIHTGP